MNQTNICSGLVIEDITLERPYFEMYNLQRKLQLRLNEFAYVNPSTDIAVTKCIYWFYCIASECKELMEWFKPENHNSLAIEEVSKEIQMEAIDIIHFVMNIGLELGFTGEEVEAVELLHPTHLDRINPVGCSEACSVLLDKCIALIDCMPWKTWKTYDYLAVSDLKSLLDEDYKMVYKMSLSLCNRVGLNRQDIVNVYFAKNKENHDRQTRGY